MDRKTVIVGMNALKCHCEDGTVFVPVTMEKMAEIRVHGSAEMSGVCTCGHTYNFLAVPGLGILEVGITISDNPRTSNERGPYGRGIS